MKKRGLSLLIASALCLSLLSTAALADETTTPCTDGQHTWGYGNPNCTTCGEPLRASASWERSSVGGYYTEVKNAFEDAQQHLDADAYDIHLMADATLDESMEIGHKGTFLYLDGCTLTLAPGGDVQSILRVLPGGYLWIREGSLSGGGKIVVDPAESGKDWVAGIELAGGKVTFDGGEISITDPYNGSAECSIVRMTGNVGNVFDMNVVSVPSGENSYAVVADGSGPEVTFRVESENAYGRIKITKNYPGSVQLCKGTFAGLELEPGEKYQSLDQLLMNYSDYQDVSSGKIVDGSGKQMLENVKVVHAHEYDEEGRCKAWDGACAPAKIVNSPNAEVNRFYEDFDEALTIARLPENDGCMLELWWGRPSANGKNGGVGYIINDGKFTLDLRDQSIEHSIGSDVPEYVLKHTGGELTLTSSGGFEMGMLRAYGPVKALGVDGGHVRIDDGQYVWGWYKYFASDVNSGCIVDLLSGELEINGGTFSSVFSDKTPDEDTKDPKILITGGSLTVTGEPVFDASMEVASDFTANGGKIALSGGTFSKITSKDASLDIAGMLAPGYVCQNADGARLSLADLRAAELENFSVVKCGHALTESGGKSVCPYCEQELTVSAAQLPGGEPRYYTDLASALEGSADLSGQVLLTMLADAEITEQVRVTGGSYVLDLNGRTLTCAVSGGDIADAGAILVTGGELTVKDGTGGGKVSVSADQGVGLCAVGGTLTVESGTYTADGASSIAIALGGAGETGTNGAVILTGGTIQPNGAGSEGVRVGNGGKALTVSGPVTVKSTANMAYGVRIAAGYQGTVSISAGTFSKIDIEAEGMTAADLLAEGFQFRNSSKRWITDLSVTQLTKTNVAAIPIRLGRMESSYDVVYKAEGKNVITLEVFAPEGGAGFEEYDLFLEFECEDENGNRGNGSTGWVDIDPDKQRAVFTLDGFLRDKDVGTYRFTVTSVKYHSSQTDAYTLPGESFTVNVRRSGTEATVETGISDSWFDKKDTFIYGQRITVRAMFDATGELPAMLAMTPPGEDQCAVFNAAGEQISEAEDAQSSGTWWLDIPGTALDVGTHALTVKYVGGRNQTGMSVPFTVTVEPRPITALVQDETPLVYNGTPLTRAVASVEADGLTLTAADYSVSGNTRTAVGTYELTVTGRGNYTGTLTGSYTVTKAPAPAAQDGALTVANGQAATYFFDFKSLLPELADPMEYGAVTYQELSFDSDYSAGGAGVTADGAATLPVKAHSGQPGAAGTVTVKAVSQNFEPFTLTVNVTAANKKLPALDGGVTLSRNTLTYGEKLSAVTLSGAMKYDGAAVAGTFAWQEPDAKLSAGTHTVGWIFTPAAQETYLEVLGTAAVTVNKAAPSGAPKYDLIKTGGKTLADAALAVNDGWPAGTVQWVDGNGNALPADTEVKANAAYRWVFTPDDADNYAGLSGSVKLYSVGSSGGGGSSGNGGASVPTYPVAAPGASGGTSVGASDGGSVSVSTKNAAAGSTVTVSVQPEDGFRLGKLTVIDKNGNEIPVTLKDGEYTFTMPAGAVEIQPVFEKIPAAPAFPDVPSNAYYAEPVKWAAENGITSGTKDGGFTPSNTCTRAQIVTFLWRAAGCPEPTGTRTAPGDISEEAYYAKAVLWALENGVTSGTKSGGFDPNAPCTRAQAVTFLARALNAGGGSAASFHDVPADSYYAAAVAWAVEHGVTNGTKDGGFSPNAACTRAQIVTFLFRAYGNAK